MNRVLVHAAFAAIFVCLAILVLSVRPLLAKPPKTGTGHSTTSASARHDLHSFRSRTSHANKCGVKLWNIKTASDPQAGSINHGPTDTTITELVGKPEPAQTDKRIQGVETTTWKLTNVKLLKMKQEADRDYHLVLSDAQGNTMIAEIPDPVCVGVGSVVAYNVNISRAAVDAKYQVPSDRWLPVNAVITVAGVGFFDFGHVAGAQDGAAKNEIELHPVVDICFGQDCEVGVEEVAAHP